MARERGSTGYSSDVPEAGQMAASLRKVPVTQGGMAVYALEWCYQKLRESGRRSYKSFVNVGGARRSHYLRVCVCVCVCVCFGLKTTCVFALVFLSFLVT